MRGVVCQALLGDPGSSSSPVTFDLGGTSLVSLWPSAYNREGSCPKVPSAKIPVLCLALRSQGWFFPWSVRPGCFRQS